MSNRWRSACRIVAKKVVRDNLALRRKLVGELRSITECKVFFNQHTVPEVVKESGYSTSLFKKNLVDRYHFNIKNCQIDWSANI